MASPAPSEWERRRGLRDMTEASIASDKLTSAGVPHKIEQDEDGEWILYLPKEKSTE